MPDTPAPRPPKIPFPPKPHPPEPWEEDFAEGGSFRHVGKGSRIAEKMNAEERARAGFKTR